MRIEVIRCVCRIAVLGSAVVKRLDVCEFLLEFCDSLILFLTGVWAFVWLVAIVDICWLSFDVVRFVEWELFVKGWVDARVIVNSWVICVEANIAGAWNCRSSWSRSACETWFTGWEWLVRHLVEAFADFTKCRIW